MKWLGSPNYDPSSRGIWEVIFPICNLERMCYDNKVRRASCKFLIAQLINENKYSLRESFYGFIRKIETSVSILKNYPNMAHWMWLIQPLSPQPNHPPPNDNRWSQLTTEFSSRCKIKPTPFCSLAAAAPTNIVISSLLLVHGATMTSLFLTRSHPILHGNDKLSGVFEGISVSPVPPYAVGQRASKAGLWIPWPVTKQSQIRREGGDLVNMAHLLPHE